MDFWALKLRNSTWKKLLSRSEWNLSFWLTLRGLGDPVGDLFTAGLFRAAGSLRPSDTLMEVPEPWRCFPVL